MEKRKFNPKIIISLYILLSFGALILSFITKIQWLTTFGMVALFGGGFLIAIITIILLFKKSNQKISNPDYDAKEDDTISKEKVNTSTGRDNNYKLARYEIDMTTRAFKACSTKEKILGTLLLVFLISVAVAAIVFINLKIELGFFICFGVFCGTIIIIAIVKTIKEKRALSNRNIDKYASKETATVISTTVSSYSTFGTGSERLGTNRITSMTYKVKLDVHGKVITTYSKEFYNSGEKIKVVMSKNGKYAKIIDEPKTSEELIDDENFGEINE